MVRDIILTSVIIVCAIVAFFWIRWMKHKDKIDDAEFNQWLNQGDVPWPTNAEKPNHEDPHNCI